MPFIFFNEKIAEHTSMSLWNATESVQELSNLASLSQDENMQLQSYTLEKRQREWLSVQILLKAILPGTQLSAQLNGKPLLPPPHHISISHCDSLAAVVISEMNIGLDLQNADVKLLRISKRFCHPKEIKEAECSVDQLAYYTVLWSAKEAIFKFYGEHIVFAEHIRIHEFQLAQPIIHANYNGVHGHRKFELLHFIYNSFHIVVAK